MKNLKTELSVSERQAFATVGRIGGKENFRKHGRKHMGEIGKKGQAVRWAKKKSTKKIK